MVHTIKNIGEVRQVNTTIATVIKIFLSFSIISIKDCSALKRLRKPDCNFEMI